MIMKIPLKSLLPAVGLLLGAGAVRGENDAVKTDAVKITQGTNGETILTLDVATQKRIGLEIASPAAADWQPEIKAYGRALDPAPLMDLLADLGRAQITFDSSHQELERAKQLKQDKNISEKAFQDIEATYRQNLATVSVARFKIETAWGKRIADMTGKIVVPPGTLRKPDIDLDKLAAGGGLIRVDLPAGERLTEPHAARIETLAKQELPVTARYFDVLPVMDPQTQQQGVLFLNDAPERLIPGEAVTAFIKTGDEPLKGVMIPASAVLRHLGKGSIFVQAGETNFFRREIPLDRPVAEGFFCADLSPADHVVVKGAQTLLSAELSGGGFNSGQRD